MSLQVSVPKFDALHYLEVTPGAREAIKSGIAKDALDHYLRYGIDENRYSLIRREPTNLSGAFERLLVSKSGFCLLLGWLADEGCDQPRFRLIGGEFNVEFHGQATFRYARPDVETNFKAGAFDYGFLAFGRSPSRSLLKQSMLFQVSAVAGSIQSRVTPEIVSDKRLLNTILQVIATCQAHAGKEAALYPFLSGSGGASLSDLFQLSVASAISGQYVERFAVRPVSHSFVTVLFGSPEPLNLQPLLFKAAKVDFGEWIFVCNSPEDADSVLRYARLISKSL